MKANESVTRRVHLLDFGGWASIFSFADDAEQSASRVLKSLERSWCLKGYILQSNGYESMG